MGAEGPAIGASMGISYGIFKDMFLYLKHKGEYQKNMHHNFSELKSQIDILCALRKDNEEKARIDTKMEMTELGKTLLLQIEQKEEIFWKLNAKYQRECKFHHEIKDDHCSEQFEDLDIKCEEDVGHLAKGNEEDLKHEGNMRLHLFRQAKLSRKLEKRRAEVADLISKMRQGDLWKQKKIEKVEKKLGDNIDDVPSLKEILQKLKEHLRDDDVRKIGIWGPPGVGKTTVLENLNDGLHQPTISLTGLVFEVVIYVNVPENGSVKDIQIQILERLGNIAKETNTCGYLADNISKTLESDKYLLILDQVSSEIDLNQLGIRNHRHGKVVIASRDKAVCRNMSVDKEIFVNRLSYLDAWHLFERLVGDIANYPPIKETAQDIVKQLGGLPQAIQFVALSLKNEKDEAIWRNMSRTLQWHDAFPNEELGAIYSSYKWAYDRLPDYEKECLRYGALFPDDYDIKKDYLIECWIAERLIYGIQLGGRRYRQQYRAARDKGKQVLRDLTDSCLLECCATEGYVKMPAMLRNMVLQDSCSRRLLVKTGEETTDKHLEEDEWRGASCVSLMCNELHTLPESPKCFRISTLFLQKNMQLTKIPYSFFTQMRMLRVLNLQHTGVKSLPPSISNLINLRSLYLNNCRHLTTLPAEIEKLTLLEVLDIQDSGFRSMPVEIGNLIGLRCLRASFLFNAFNPVTEDSGCRRCCSSRVIVPPNILNKLHRLEELTLLVDPKEETWKDNVQQVAEEVACLSTITSLGFYFPTGNSFESFITTRRSGLGSGHRRKNNLSAFHILIGGHQAHHPYTESSGQRYFKFSGDEEISPSVKEVLKQATSFELIDHPNLQSLSDFGTENMESLKVCAIEGCNRIRCIFKGNMAGGAAFRFLRKLQIVNLQNLNCIVEGPVKTGSLCRLTTLILNGCPALTTFLTPGVAHELSQLLHLHVENCCRLLCIIEPEVAKQSGVLGRLKRIELINLPKLHSICERDTLDWPKLETIEIDKCRSLRNLSVSANNAHLLKQIKCEEEWWRGIELQDDVRKHLPCFCNFPAAKLTVTGGDFSEGSFRRDKGDHSSESSWTSDHKPIDDESLQLCFPFITKRRGWQKLK